VIAPWPLGPNPVPLEEGYAIFAVDKMRQHAGIVASTATSDRPLDVYAVFGPGGLKETWNIPEESQFTIAGYVQGPETDEVLGNVLRECNRIESLVEGAVANGGNGCCWRLTPYRLLEDAPSASIVFKGSCAGFVEHCYERAGIDLVDEADLPVTQWTEGESNAIRNQYEKAKPTKTIRRLYAAYQIRAFQQEQYPWSPDLRFRWFPEGFDDSPESLLPGP
jgi:hypothetical protein